MRLFTLVPVRLFALAIGLSQIAAAAYAHDAAWQQELEPRQLRLGDGFGPAVSAPEPLPSKWFFKIAAVNVYPKMESEKPIETLFNPAMRLLAPGFDDVRTVGGLRDKGRLWPPHLGFGRVLSDHWVLSFQAGYTVGKVRTKANDASRFRLPLHTDFEIQRGALFAGASLDFYPFTTPDRKKFHGLVERLRAARPMVGLSLTWTYATYNAKIKVGFKPLPNIVNLELEDAWTIPSISPRVGLDVPLTPRTQIGFDAGYNFFADEKQDFEGPSYTIAWKYFFK